VIRLLVAMPNHSLQRTADRRPELLRYRETNPNANDDKLLDMQNA
jgi:hypothetical protein